MKMKYLSPPHPLHSITHASTFRNSLGNITAITTGTPFDPLITLLGNLATFKNNPNLHKEAH